VRSSLFRLAGRTRVEERAHVNVDEEAVPVASGVACASSRSEPGEGQQKWQNQHRTHGRGSRSRPASIVSTSPQELWSYSVCMVERLLGPMCSAGPGALASRSRRALVALKRPRRPGPNPCATFVGINPTGFPLEILWASYLAGPDLSPHVHGSFTSRLWKNCWSLRVLMNLESIESCSTLEHSRFRVGRRQPTADSFHRRIEFRTQIASERL
jgi:hypothetical protein